MTQVNPTAGTADCRTCSNAYFGNGSVKCAAGSVNDPQHCVAGDHYVAAAPVRIYESAVGIG